MIDIFALISSIFISLSHFAIFYETGMAEHGSILYTERDCGILRIETT